jgi:exodeoxyribonuclease VII large subunit
MFFGDEAGNRAVNQLPFNLQPDRKVFTVSELTTRIRELLVGKFPDLWVEGEISNVREAQSGHLYFTLKDARAQIRCVCFRNEARLLKFRPEDGLHVTVRGALGVYEQRGEYQINVATIEPVGLGALQLAFEQLKARLDAEGLFDPARKKPLPLLPRRIGVVTSPAGAAVRDILRVLRRRFPNLRVLVYPVRVQGEGAAGEIVEAIRYFNRARAADALIVARGGGSLEDLWAFNEESVARAIAASQIPIIVGVGHETDFTIADFVADVRAPTPSAAAELVVRTRREFDRHLAELDRRMAQRMRYRLLECRHRLQQLRAHPGFRQLEDRLRQRRQRVDELTLELGNLLGARLGQARERCRAIQARLAGIDLRARIAMLRGRLEQRLPELAVRVERLLARRRRALETLVVKLDERSPLRVLDRGYAICYDAAGQVVRDAAAVAVNDPIAVRLARGRLEAIVRGKKEG